LIVNQRFDLVSPFIFISKRNTDIDKCKIKRQNLVSIENNIGWKTGAKLLLVIKGPIKLTDLSLYKETGLNTRRE